MYMIIAHLPINASVSPLTFEVEFLDEFLRNKAEQVGVRLEHARVQVDGSRFSVALFVMAANLEEGKFDALVLLSRTLDELNRHAL